LLALTLLSGRATGDERPITKEERAHWAFIAPSRPSVPKPKGSAWVRNPIDAFILSALEESNLAPAREAERTTLLRRVTFDLTGLPPSSAEIDAFLADSSREAYERVVDRLLANPRYGERWAQHWLDLARYADTDGFEFDQARPDAWRFRDWVISALNDDLPYDRFLTLQLAGDEVAPESNGALIATGFNRCYPDMVDLNDQALRRQNALNDITDTTGLAFLGLTIGCARCHDHKFDPIRITDYYRLQAFFAPARFRDDLTIASQDERTAYEARRAAWVRDSAEVQDSVLRIERPWREVLSPGRPPGLDDETIAAFDKNEDDRSPREIGLVYEVMKKDRRIKPATWPLVLDRFSLGCRSSLLRKLEHLALSEPAKPPQARGIDEAGQTSPPTFTLLRGDFFSKGPEVVPAFPTVLRPEGAVSAAEIVAQPRSTGRRRTLAAWLTRSDHPLTARVMVNRVWQHHFGRGIVATPSDFGTMGDEPTHSELLDWLATELIARGWSLKAMHRLMVTSATYRQSSHPERLSVTSDPENTLLSRFRRTRLDGEAIRDAMLAVSGQLSGVMGGPPVYPELPAELTKLSSKGLAWPVSSRVEERARRSIYVFVRRNLRFPFFEAFDRPDTNASCPGRSSTTIAPQALTLLNSKIADDAATALAAKVLREAGPEPAAQVRLAFRLAFARDPDSSESALALDFIARDPSPSHFALALLNANEFVYID
jgi:hypothetical protein